MRFNFVLFGLMAASSPAANLAFSTYLKDGFTPTAITSDSQGNLYLAGSVVTDAASGATGILVAKLDPTASAFLYLDYLDSSAQDNLGGISADSTGDLYVVGSTSNPNFPATAGMQQGTLPLGPNDRRSFVTKLDAKGNVLFSVLLGGSAASSARAIALTPHGQILISGVSDSSGFPITAGAYAVPDSKDKPFLMELDATASNVIFSATGIGGSSITVDNSGNIYVSGSTTALDYPTTSGVYQQTFVPAFVCGFPPCETPSPGLQQYLTKVDPTGSRLIYSTGINDQTPYLAGSAMNVGLAIDSAGNAYVTGVSTGPYPFTTPPPASPMSVPFVTKLNSTATSLVYSTPIGGVGVQFDSSGALYTAGTTTGLPLPVVLGWVPAQCLAGGFASTSEVYAAKLDPATGNVLDAEWIDASALEAEALTLASGRVWIAGATQRADVPFTPGALSPSNPSLPGETILTPGSLPGAYLGAVDFSQPTTRGPMIGCVLDGADLMHTGPVAANQLLSIFATNLGPHSGVSAANGSTTSLAGVSVTFDGNPAPLLYVSSSQINVAVPTSVATTGSTVMQVLVNGDLARPRQLPVVPTNLNLFLNLTPLCPTVGIQALVTNSDGTANSCANPAALGSTVSYYLEGSAATSLNATAVVGTWSTEVVQVALQGPFVWKVDIVLPSSIPPGAEIILAPHLVVDVLISEVNKPIGPFALANTGGVLEGQPIPTVLWIKH